MTIPMDCPDGVTPLDPDEMAGLKFKHITTLQELDELEQANIEEGLQWLARRRPGKLGAIYPNRPTVQCVPQENSF
jgi:fido (protein-threonine AMPylation protein)